MDKRLPDNLKNQISSSFYELSDRPVMNSIGSEGFVPATKETFSSLNPQNRKLKLYESILAE